MWAISNIKPLWGIWIPFNLGKYHYKLKQDKRQSATTGRSTSPLAFNYFCKNGEQRSSIARMALKASFFLNQDYTKKSQDYSKQRWPKMGSLQNAEKPQEAEKITSRKLRSGSHLPHLLSKAKAWNQKPNNHPIYLTAFRAKYLMGSHCFSILQA